MNEPEVVRDMLGDPPSQPRTIAVIGLADDPDKPSNYVPAYMQKQGYRILPINPTVETVLGERPTRASPISPSNPTSSTSSACPDSFLESSTRCSPSA